MSQIQVTLVDQNIIFKNSPQIYSGDRNTDIIEFEFDEIWDNYAKTAVFYKDIEQPQFRVLDADKCVIPWEVLTEPGSLYIGVVGVQNDKVITSEIKPYTIGQGAITPAETPPPEDIWQQIISELMTIRALASQLIKDQEEYQKHWDKEVESSITEAKQATIQCYDAISALNVEIFDMDGGDPFTQPSDDDIDINGGYPG